MARPVYKYQINLSGGEKKELRQAKKKGRKNARLVIRILVILLANAGKTIAQSAAMLDCCEQTVLNQRKQFLERRSAGPMAALLDLPRSGRPVTYGAKEQAQVIVIVCETLHEHNLPLSRFSITDLQGIIVKEENLATLSHATLGRMFLSNENRTIWPSKIGPLGLI